jgi:hypothetical protein
MNGHFSCIRSSYCDSAMANGGEVASRRSSFNLCVKNLQAPVSQDLVDGSHLAYANRGLRPTLTQFGARKTLSNWIKNQDG